MRILKLGRIHLQRGAAEPQEGRMACLEGDARRGGGNRGLMDWRLQGRTEGGRVWRWR